jgi:hypothetical protein
MSRWTQISGATALACVFSASAGFADVTGQEVWNDWKSYLQDFGYTVSGAESRSGDTLTIADLVMSMDTPETDGRVTMTMPELTFTDQGDGTVAVGLPETSSMEVTAQSPEGDAFDMTIDMTMTGMSTIVSGAPDNMTYSYTAASIGMALADLNADGDLPDEFTFGLTLNNLIGQSSMKIGEMREVAQTISAQGLSYDLRIAETSEDVTFLVNGGADGLQFDGTSVIPIGVNMEDASALLKSGFKMEGTVRQNSAQAKMSFVEGDDSMTIDSSTGSGEVELAFSDAGFKYIGGGSDIAVNVVGGEIPFPVAIQLAEAGYEFQMPLAASDAEQDFALGLTFGGLSVPDMLWNIFDPSAILPRDPATVSFALNGKTRLFQDLMDPTLEPGDDFPGELTALTLSDLVVEVAGAELTGSGDFTFDNSDVESFDGLPRPQGAVDFRLLGGNGLLDKIIQMGFISQDDAMGARMMMGIFATPGPSEDELNSRIEVNEAGHVLANGQRLR